MNSIFNFFFSILFLSILASRGLLAQTVAPPTLKPVANMIKTATSYEMVFPDGRVAQVFRQHGENRHSAIYLKQTENTCEPELALTTCQINVELKPYFTDLRWVKNSDPSRLNKVVNLVYGQEPSVYRQPVQGASDIATWFLLKASRAEDVFSLAPDEFVCADYRWMMSAEAIPSEINITSWSGELMTANPESKVTENMTSGGGMGVRLRRGPQNQYYFDGFKALYPSSAPSIFPPFISAQIMNLNIASPKHKGLCQITFESNVSQIVALVQSPNFQKLDPATLTPAGQSYWEYNDGALKYYLRELVSPTGSFANGMRAE